MKTTKNPAGFVLLSDSACCGISGGMSSPNIEGDLAYMLGELLGRTFRTLYDIGDKWWQRLSGKPKVEIAY